MKKQLLVLVVLIECSCTRAVPEPVAAFPQTISELSGRTPAKTQRCVRVDPGRLLSTSNSDPRVLLYEDGKTLWASNLDADCDFSPGQTVIPDSSGPYYCKGDLVRAGGRINLRPFGRMCALGNFTAYNTN